MMPAPLSRRPALRDALVALLTAAVAVSGSFAASRAGGDLNAYGLLLLLLAAGVLAVRSRHPLLVVPLTSAAMLLYHLGDYPGQAIAVPLLIALYTAVRLGHRLIALVPAGAVVAVIVTQTLDGGADSPNETVMLAGWLVAGAVFGEVSRQRAAYVRQVEERAAEAERTREEAAAHLGLAPEEVPYLFETALRAGFLRTTYTEVRPGPAVRDWDDDTRIVRSWVGALPAMASMSASGSTPAPGTRRGS
jgi:hypothetical protein